MFCILFGWRKASKCKKMIKRALSRLKMLKKKRYSILRQLREDLAELISNGYQQIAFNRVEQLIRDESLMEVYDLIGNFCEFILLNFSHVRKHKTCPDDVIEAISSLVFASARCGDFPELKSVRKLFEERYGRSLATTAVELGPGNLVNPQIKEKLLMKPVSDHEKKGLISEIARDCFHPGILALEYCPDWHQKQVLENGDQTRCERKEEPKIQDSNAEEFEREVICDSSSSGSGSHYTSSSSLVCQSAPSSANGREDVCSSSALASSDLLSWKARECKSNGWIASATFEDASSPECSPFSEETLFYLDDVVELPNPSMEEAYLWDQRFLKFKSPATGMRENVQDGNDQGLIEHHNNSNKRPLSERSSQSMNKSPERSMRRSTHREDDSLSHPKNKLMKCCCLSCHSSWLPSGLENYCLEQPSYVYSEAVISEKKKVDSHFVLDNSLSGKDRDRVEFDTFPGTQKIRSCEVETVVYDVFVYSHCQPVESKETNTKPEEMQNSFTKCTKAANKYLRHVHPKLPDYDEITAKFIALKREYLQRKQHQ